MNDEISPRNQHYFFTHLEMKNYFFNKIDLSFSIIPKEKRDSIILQLWKSTKKFYSWNKRKSIIDISGMKNFIEFIDFNKFILVIQLPEPIAMTEAYFIGGYYQNNYSTVEKRYFTLEYHDSLITCFCEWGDFGHRLYGNEPDKTLECFVNRIKEVVNEGNK